jgi:putative addiction module component (TIGR02574 family)
MTRDAKQLLDAALGLSEQDRATIASSLIESLEQPSDIDVEEAWQEEVTKRLNDIQSGNIKPISWLDARKAITDTIK